MTSEVKENTAFAELVPRLDRSTIKDRAAAERIPANMTSADGQAQSDGAHLVRPKLGAASGRCVG